MAPDEKVARVHLELMHDYQFVVSFPDLPGATAIAVDESPPLGHGAGPNPAALLAAAIGNCLAASLVFCMRKARAHVDRITVDATAHIIRAESGRFRIGSVDVELSPGVPAEDLSRLTRCEGLFEDFCIVTQSVQHGIPVNIHVKETQPT